MLQVFKTKKSEWEKGFTMHDLYLNDELVSMKCSNTEYKYIGIVFDNKTNTFVNGICENDKKQLERTLYYNSLDGFETFILEF